MEKQPGLHCLDVPLLCECTHCTHLLKDQWIKHVSKIPENLNGEGYSSVWDLSHTRFRSITVTKENILVFLIFCSFNHKSLESNTLAFTSGLREHHKMDPQHYVVAFKGANFIST